MPIIDILDDYYLQYWVNIDDVVFDTKRGVLRLRRKRDKPKDDGSLIDIVMTITGVTDVFTKNSESLGGASWFHDGLIYYDSLYGHGKPFEVVINHLESRFRSDDIDLVQVKLCKRFYIISHFGVDVDVSYAHNGTIRDYTYVNRVGENARREDQ